MSEPSSNYSPFAWFYDRYWGAEIPFKLMKGVEKLLLPRLSAGCRILDLCCGTGQIAAELAARQFRVTGIDGSEEMLRYARQRAAAVEFILDDARSFNQPPVYDGIISTFDSLNHMMSLEELTAVFRNVHSALRVEGLFLFDMNMEKGFLLHWRDYFAIVESDHVCVLRGAYDPDEKIGRYDITMFKQDEDEWKRADAVINEKCYAAAEIEKALRKAGFAEVSSYDAETEIGLEEHIGRAFFLARR